MHRAQISPVPPEPVEIWLAGHAPKALDRAARMADGWVGGPGAPIEQATSLADGYRRACAEHNRDPGTIAIRRDVYVGRDAADAKRVEVRAVESGYRGFDPEVLIIGDVERVVARLRPLADVGVDEVVVRHIAENQEAVLASSARLTEVRSALLRQRP